MWTKIIEQHVNWKFLKLIRGLFNRGSDSLDHTLAYINNKIAEIFAKASKID